ncbi:uncharacterized protein LOC134819854 [Bolinopsis microptera]|uniref:uncharacterized protein LOC134819854 n=1 Tax=Bolinopsis microptera TaxID=2820187 RepID=UPI00307A2F58
MKYTLSLLLCLVSVCSAAYPPLEPCPGENRGHPRGKYGDEKCHHSRTHRVCAKIVDKSSGQCTAVEWGERNFWEITSQERYNWKNSVCYGRNPGEHWCICMWATANMINQVGCDNVDINCAATDIPYVLSRMEDSRGRCSGSTRWDLKETKECLQRKCPEPES